MLVLSIQMWLGVLPVAMRLTSFRSLPSQRYTSTWFRRLAAVTNHFMSRENCSWYGSMIPYTTRCTSAVRGSRKVSESPAELATMTDFSSGVM
ncbi:hypothetical protein D9M72_346270 [compost metagenome]